MHEYRREQDDPHAPKQFEICLQQRCVCIQLLWPDEYLKVS